MKTKIFVMFLAAVASVGTMFADTPTSGTCGKNLTWRIYSDNLYIEGSGAMTDYEIYTLVPWYEYRNKIKTISLPNALTSIGTYAFFECTNLFSIDIPINVEVIGDWAFAYCSKLYSITVPNSIRYIGEYAFVRCNNINAYVQDNLRHVGPFVQGPYSASQSTCYPIQSSKWIGAYAFADSKSLFAVGLPEGIQYIGREAFARCAKLYMLSLPHSLTRIGNQAFEKCDELSTVTIPNGVTEIGEYAFFSCKGLTYLSLPQSLTTIKIWAFDGCNALKSVTCYAETPPSVSLNFFESINANAVLYVPSNSIDAYKAADAWKKSFAEIRPIAATWADVSFYAAAPSEKSVDVSWLKVENDSIYTIEIETSDHTTICKTSFNSNGELLSQVQNMPARNGSAQPHNAAAETENGWIFTFEGLQPGTDYAYSVKILYTDKTEALLHSDMFKTTGTSTALDGIDSSSLQEDKGRLILHDGHLLIEHNGRTYTLTGQELR